NAFGPLLLSLMPRTRRYGCRSSAELWHLIRRFAPGFRCLLLLFRGLQPGGLQLADELHAVADGEQDVLDARVAGNGLIQGMERARGRVARAQHFPGPEHVVQREDAARSRAREDR